MHYTDEQRYAANEIPIIDVLHGLGEQTKRIGNVTIWTAHDSVRFSGSKWYRFATGESGHSVDFVMNFFGMEFGDAMEYLLQNYRPDMLNVESAERKIPVRKTTISEPQDPPFIEKRIAAENIPPKNKSTDIVRDYLCNTRCIASKVVSFFIQEGVLYESAGGNRVVFAGKDAEENLRNIQCRGTDDTNGKYRKNVKGSDLSYGFCHTGTSNRLYVFEAPIDMLSFITMYQKDWQQHSYLALNGVSKQALVRILSENMHLEKIILCLDNDKAGNEACGRIVAELQNPQYEFQRLQPELKDWNEDLVAMVQQQEGGIGWKPSLS